MIDDKMKLQTDDFSCGPIALQKCVLLFKWQLS